MKRSNFVREITNKGCYLSRHGKRHDIYINPKSGKKAPIPRHKELSETLCKLIKKQLGL